MFLQQTANLRRERDDRDKRDGRERQDIIGHPQPNFVKVKVGLEQGLGWGWVGLGWGSAIKWY